MRELREPAVHHHRRRDLSGRPLPLRPRLALAAGAAPRLPSHRKSRERFLLP